MDTRIMYSLLSASVSYYSAPSTGFAGPRSGRLLAAIRSWLRALSMKMEWRRFDTGKSRTSDRLIVSRMDVFVCYGYPPKLLVDLPNSTYLCL